MRKLTILSALLTALLVINVGCQPGAKREGVSHAKKPKPPMPKTPFTAENNPTTLAGRGQPDLDDLTAAVGALLVELMVQQRPQSFGPWVDAVKYGKDWETALAEDYGVSRSTLVDAFVQYYRVND